MFDIGREACQEARMDKKREAERKWAEVVMGEQEKKKEKNEESIRLKGSRGQKGRWRKK